jgi:hypothetical protein
MCGPALTSGAMESVALVVPARFCGPPDTGNGGYTAGLLAARLPAAAPVRVTLRQPPPLESSMLVSAEGDVLSASFGGAVIATAEPGELVADQVPPVPFATARAAQASYAGLVGHPFPGCFVCGPDRPPGGPEGGLGLRPGQVGDYGPDGDGWVATTWVPDPTLLVDGRIPAAIVWAALDCPGGWANDLVDRPMVLGRMTASVDAVPVAGDRCVVVGRRVGLDGRKAFTASTAYDADGRVLGHAESTWIAI